MYLHCSITQKPPSSTYPSAVNCWLLQMSYEHTVISFPLLCVDQIPQTSLFTLIPFGEDSGAFCNICFISGTLAGKQISHLIFYPQRERGNTDSPHASVNTQQFICIFLFHRYLPALHSHRRGSPNLPQSGLMSECCVQVAKLKLNPDKPEVILFNKASTLDGGVFFSL